MEIKEQNLKNIHEARIDKLKRLEAGGVLPFPSETKRNYSCVDALRDFDFLVGEKKGIVIAGRVKSFRAHGGSTFAHIEDESGKIQVYLKRDEMGAEKYDLFIDCLDLGDFVEVEGFLFETKKGEKTLQVKSLSFLAKALLPLPQEWYGLKDQEIRYRKRYIDLAANEEVRSLFRKRSEFIGHVRDFMNKSDFLEVETSVLEHTPGGADAEPFITHHRVLDVDFYLRISLELQLKRLIVGGYERVFEIGKVFRNEGMDNQHLQEFTEMEFYVAYWDWQKLMSFVEELYVSVIEKVAGGLKVKFGEYELDFSRPWPKLDYFDLMKEKADVDLNNISDEDLRQAVKEAGGDARKELGRGRLIDQLYKKKVRPQLIQPCFLVGHPLEISPLAKKDPNNEKKTERFQVLIATQEIGNGFSELNDPLDQEQRFEEQMKLRQKGDKEAQMIDEDFVEALSYGMPPTAGFGVGLDRLFMIIANQQSVRDVVFFPMMGEKRDEK